MSGLHDTPAGSRGAEAPAATEARQDPPAPLARPTPPAPPTPAAALPGSAAALPGSAAAGAGAASATYLDRIVPAVIRRLEERKQRWSQSQLAAMAGPGYRASFAAALHAPGVSLIAEVKRSSPSKGPIRPGLEVGSIVEAYERSGARAVSVLTEEDFFGGSLEDLRTAATHTGLPLLRKDFILDPYQIYEARAFGASAVLLIAALLDDPRLRELAGLSHRLGLDVLLEVHDEAELARALAVDGVIVGINNRDLRTFEVSLDTTARLAALVPGDRLLVGESGIRDNSHVARLAARGVDGVLVGESILAKPDVEEAITALMLPAPAVVPRPDGHTRTKEAR